MADNFDRSVVSREAALAVVASIRQQAQAKLARVNAQAIRASAQKIDAGDQAAGKAWERRRQKAAWQGDAWDYYDNVPECGHGGRFFGNNLSKLRVFSGYIVDPSQPPVPVDTIGEDRQPIVSLAEQQVAQAALARIQSPDGGHAELLRDYGLNQWVAGDCTLLGLPDEDTMSGERWGIYSTDELTRKGGRWLLREDPGVPDSDATVVPDDAPMYRLWTRHPRWSALPDSPMRRVLEVCDELMILTRAIRSAGVSRVARGAFVIPESALKGAPDVTQNAETDGEELADPTVASIVDHFMAPHGASGSAAEYAPYVFAVPDESVDKVRYIEFGAPFSEGEANARRECIVRLANGVDLPAEVLLGMADVNHWTAWQIDEQTFKAYLEPYAVNFCTSLTWAYYRKALAEAGVTDPSRHVIWYDESEVVGRGNQAESSNFGVSNGGLGWPTWRRVNGYAEADAPTEEEAQQRLAEQRGVLDTETTNTLLRAIGLLAAGAASATSTTDGAPPPEQPAAPTPTTEAPPELPSSPEAPPATVAAAFTPSRRSPSLGQLSQRLGRIDQALRARLTAAADAAMRRALERAGARLRTKALRASANYRDAIDGVPNEQVASRLGPTVVAALDSDTDTVLRESFAELEPRFMEWVDRAQRSAIAEMQRAGLDLDDTDLESLTRSQESDRRAAWALMLGLLVRQANERLFAPDLATREPGEVDGTVAVSPALIRQVLARAGGAEGTATSGGAVLVGPAEQLAGAIGSGERVREALATVSISTAGFQWLYGDPGSRTSNFEPHEALDGTEFSSFTDPVLANSEAWPAVAYYHPGDHRGCQCDFAPLFTEGDTTTDEGDAATLAPLED